MKKMNCCKNTCKNFLKGDNSRVYTENGCFCRNCDYYFKELFNRCPCCNTLTRRNTRNNKEQRTICRI